MKSIRLEKINLQIHKELDEKWIQNIIADDTVLRRHICG
jgi:ABC-type phosphate transport system auxiliary subunit